MKAIALLAALLAFALPAKAEEDSKLAETKAYFFGFIYGSGPTLRRSARRRNHKRLCELFSV